MHMGIKGLGKSVISQNKFTNFGTRKVFSLFINTSTTRAYLQILLTLGGYLQKAQLKGAFGHRSFNIAFYC